MVELRAVVTMNAGDVTKNIVSQLVVSHVVVSRQSLVISCGLTSPSLEINDLRLTTCD